MRWHDEKISLPNVPARVDPTIKYSSATHSPKKTKSLRKKQTKKHITNTNGIYIRIDGCVMYAV